MSIDQERAAELKQSSVESADNDPMLQAYGRYWVPHVKRIAVALEKIEAHLAKLVETDKAADDDK
jgi:hypothetical protein